MAVRDEYVDASASSSSQLTALRALNGNGTNGKWLLSTFEVAAADSDASVFRLFRALSPTLIPLRILVANDAIAGGTDWDVGLYEAGVAGAVIDKDIFADGLSFVEANQLKQGGDEFVLEFPIRDADETSADGVTYKRLMSPGVKCKLVDAWISALTAPVGGTNTVKILNGSSAGNTMLSAASVDPTGMTDNQVLKMALSSTASDLVLNASGAGSGAYAEWVSGTQTTDMIGAVIGLRFQRLNSGMKEIDIANFNKRLYEHAGHTIANMRAAYDLCLTANTIGSGAGTVTVAMEYADG